MRLNVEELNFLAALDAVTKEAAVQEILSRLPYMKNRELEEIAEHVVLKLDAMNDDEFAALDLAIYREE